MRHVTFYIAVFYILSLKKFTVGFSLSIESKKEKDLGQLRWCSGWGGIWTPAHLARKPGSVPETRYVSRAVVSSGELLPPRAQLAMSVDSFGHHSWQEGAPGIWRAESRDAVTSPAAQNALDSYPAHMSIVPRLRSPALGWQSALTRLQWAWCAAQPHRTNSHVVVGCPALAEGAPGIGAPALKLHSFSAQEKQQKSNHVSAFSPAKAF